jgi:asparaginyl-tRNA synthetase
MVEPEMAFFDLDALIETEEQFVSYIVQTVLAKHQQELEILERDTAALEKIQAPFDRITYTDAVERLQKLAAKPTTPN